MSELRADSLLGFPLEHSDNHTESGDDVILLDLNAVNDAINNPDDDLIGLIGFMLS